ncbi:dTDP-3-amino-3,4,6-trideoxy-alpha-D-glucose transaminase [Rhodovastum atsumiense]|uniref:DegT/DnrJ/EryC1/StrS family aminotransferase n=1 Tax=Rhodovastum atsumiense TaxID=504468 RepID=A0A5M6ITA6_9PROT|nr:DegT/DnrJ/EryC1/StrS family aminotransferase [Rhodovastum atsumiense]KAA5610788.1 DegT/DnrJ/EryC1/StrS family aminotransferase [Rhodovastum atsumiense]CAH2604459.1 dTDP-3-amino-3,4,6-trideoxy-alpha-D-glucose transaminase [Rhodovastum atsumiense]
MTSTPLSVPQANPGAGYRALKPEIDAAIQRALASGWYVLGEEGRGFEREFAAWLGIPHAVGCGNGTDALALALRALGIGPGCAVATVSHTAVATVAAIEMAGATPVLIDIDPRHYTIDPVELDTVLAHPPAGLPPIRAVIPVHLYGQAADLDAIAATCDRHGAAMIEDCSQAHGATLHGRTVGTFGQVACFSLYPTKNLGALGDGGVIATADTALAERLAALRQYGWRRHYISEDIGVNSRLDELQAAILRAKLPHLHAQNARRAAIAARYDAALAGTAITPPARRPEAGHVFHQYVIRVPDRAALQARLRERGIGTGVHYPVPVHLQAAYCGRVALGPAACRESERAAAEVLSLPMYPELTDAQVDQVCTALT